MKIPAKLVASILLLSLIKDAIPSNPDSEIAQDPEKDGAGARQNGRPESRPKIELHVSRYSGTRLSRPYATNVEIFWREAIGTSFGRERIRNNANAPYWHILPDALRINRNNRTYLVVPPEHIMLNPFDVAPPPISMIPSTTDKRSNEDRTRNTGDGTFSNSGGNRPFPGPGTQGTWNNRNGARDPIGSRRNTNDGTAPGGNVSPDRNIGKETTRPSGENRVSPVPPNPQGGATTSPTHNKRISPDANLFAGIVNNFAFRLMESMNLESNFVISPLSIFVALSMIYLGADGKTKAQMEEVLGLNENAVHGIHLHQGISDLVSMFSSGSDEYQLFFANGMFLGRNFTVEEPFMEDILKYYGAELKNLDFGNQQKSLRVINEWVAKNTRNTIESISDNPLPVFTRLVLLNAIFFKGIWKMQFPRDFTQNNKFFTLDGNEKETPFMNLHRESFPIFRSDEQQHSFIKLPYQGDQVSMIIALPYSREDKPMPSTTDQILCHVRDGMINMQMSTVSIPKFSLEYLRSLKEPLKKLGITDIFDSSVNLSKMRKSNDVFVSKILHKAVIDVNEEGTTASAATAVQVVPYSLLRNDFEANHPFAFYVVHEDSGLVLFYGKVYDLGEGTGAATGNGRENVPVPANNGRENVQVPPNNSRNNPQVTPNNGRENVQVPPNNSRNNPQVTPSNERENVQVSSGYNRNNPQVQSRWERPQFTNYRRENLQVSPGNRW